MGLFDAYSYKGKRAVVAGAASGMGAAAVDVLKDAGAEVMAMDIAPIEADGVEKVELNLADTDSIDAAVDAIGAPVHALLSCAGVADGTPGIEKINFLGHRHMIEKMLEADLLPRGSAIGFISSAAGLGWEKNLETINAYLDMDLEEASQWAQENGRADYMWSKQVINGYVARQALPMAQKGIRINAILPGPTVTPLAEANREQWLSFGQDFRDDAGIEASTPLEQAYPLIFLCSEAAAGVSGITLVTDAGMFGAGASHAHEGAKEAMKFLRGEYGPL